ncbi:unnamed protein product [Amoebophrya sp. A120]|nr:unnamed protein product [Amoebophrya sp. A120]|eukprot:GSA120T00008688001.1
MIAFRADPLELLFGNENRNHTAASKRSESLFGNNRGGAPSDQAFFRRARSKRSSAIGQRSHHAQQGPLTDEESCLSVEATTNAGPTGSDKPRTRIFSKRNRESVVYVLGDAEQEGEDSAGYFAAEDGGENGVEFRINKNRASSSSNSTSYQSSESPRTDIQVPSVLSSEDDRLWSLGNGFSVVNGNSAFYFPTSGSVRGPRRRQTPVRGFLRAPERVLLVESSSSDRGDGKMQIFSDKSQTDMVSSGSAKEAEQRSAPVSVLPRSAQGIVEGSCDVDLLSSAHQESLSELRVPGAVAERGQSTSGFLGNDEKADKRQQPKSRSSTTSTTASEQDVDRSVENLRGDGPRFGATSGIISPEVVVPGDFKTTAGPTTTCASCPDEVDLLPDPLWFHIFLYLPASDWVSLSATNGFFYQLAVTAQDLLAARISPLQLVPSRNNMGRAGGPAPGEQHPWRGCAAVEVDASLDVNTRTPGKSTNFAPEQLSLYSLQRLARLEECYVFDVFDQVGEPDSQRKVSVDFRGDEAIQGVKDLVVKHVQHYTSSSSGRGQDAETPASEVADGKIGSGLFAGAEGGAQFCIQRWNQFRAWCQTVEWIDRHALLGNTAASAAGRGIERLVDKVENEQTRGPTEEKLSGCATKMTFLPASSSSSSTACLRSATSRRSGTVSPTSAVGESHEGTKHSHLSSSGQEKAFVSPQHKQRRTTREMTAATTTTEDEIFPLHLPPQPRTSFLRLPLTPRCEYFRRVGLPAGVLPGRISVRFRLQNLFAEEREDGDRGLLPAEDHQRGLFTCVWRSGGATEVGKLEFRNKHRQVFASIGLRRPWLKRFAKPRGKGSIWGRKAFALPRLPSMPFRTILTRCSNSCATEMKNPNNKAATGAASTIEAAAGNGGSKNDSSSEGREQQEPGYHDEEAAGTGAPSSCADTDSSTSDEEPDVTATKQAFFLDVKQYANFHCRVPDVRNPAGPWQDHFTNDLLLEGTAQLEITEAEEKDWIDVDFIRYDDFYGAPYFSEDDDDARGSYHPTCTTTSTSARGSLSKPALQIWCNKMLVAGVSTKEAFKKVEKRLKSRVHHRLETDLETVELRGGAAPDPQGQQASRACSVNFDLQHILYARK